MRDVAASKCLLRSGADGRCHEGRAAGFAGVGRGARLARCVAGLVLHYIIPRVHVHVQPCIFILHSQLNVSVTVNGLDL